MAESLQTAGGAGDCTNEAREDDERPGIGRSRCCDKHARMYSCSGAAHLGPPLFVSNLDFPCEC
jgi:hypothetical protein